MTRTKSPVIVVRQAGSNLCIVQIAPGADASVEPLLSHAGLACELGGPVTVAMGGITGRSDRVRQFLTSVDNDLEEEVLRIAAADMCNPEWQAQGARTKEEHAKWLRRADVEVRVVDIPSDTPDMPEP